MTLQLAMLGISLLLVCLAPAHGWWLVKDEVCFPAPYGCFSREDPFENTGKLPQSPEECDTKFYLYTRRNRQYYHLLKEDDVSYTTYSNFNASLPTKMIIHGYQDDGSTPWRTKMINTILDKENVNVISVEWLKGANKVNYKQAAANTRIVGAVTARLIDLLHSRGAPYSSFHLIGHSLGSHVSGYAGKRINKLGRITGLDPAGPCFEKYSRSVRLNSDDAILVDNIHTDAETLWQLAFGLEKPLGDLDFFPNLGYDQPGCPQNVGDHLFELITGSIGGFVDGIACSHMRAIDLFTASITAPTGKFKAYPCASTDDYDAGRCKACGAGCATMGYHATKTVASGVYYLDTTGTWPFYQ